jgi:hypothetical protein
MRIMHGKSGEVILIYRPHILWFSGRTRVIKEKVRATRSAGVTRPRRATVAVSAALEALAAWVPPERGSRY